MANEIGQSNAEAFSSRAGRQQGRSARCNGGHDTQRVCQHRKECSRNEGEEDQGPGPSNLAPPISGLPWIPRVAHAPRVGTVPSQPSL
jgi:hypothetical protein